MRLVEALQDANKDFELMIYPSSRHGIFGPHYSSSSSTSSGARWGRPAEKEKTGSPGEIASPSTSPEGNPPQPEGRPRGRRRAAASAQ